MGDTLQNIVHITDLKIYSVLPIVLFSIPGDRSHVQERLRNSRTGEEEQRQEFMNMDESKYSHVIFHGYLDDSFKKSEFLSRF